MGSENVTRLSGSCHCGNLETRLETKYAPEDLPLRADQCSFCVKHGARTTTDPGGRAWLTAHRPNELIRYRFALRTADFWICRRCGVYVGAVLSDRGRSWATLNVGAFEAVRALQQPARPVSRVEETVEERIERRKTTWTPVFGIRPESD